ncbi:MAG: hypothetical protein U0794_02250 [Isosphaeraceae bacterium]
MKTAFHAWIGTLLMLCGVSEGALQGDEPETRPVAAAPGTYTWTGGCSIKCMDGTCQSFCSTGLVTAFDAGEARIKAQADLKAQASTRGTVIEASVSVTVTLGPNASEPDTLNASPVLKRYTWTGYANLRRNGQEITVQDSGVVFAENGDYATYLAGNAMRYGDKVKSLEAQGWDCRRSHATCTGPLP